MAEALRKEPDVNVELIDGSRSELSVQVDGQEVAHKNGSFPPVEDVVKKVRETGQPTGAKP